MRSGTVGTILFTCLLIMVSWGGLFTAESDGVILAADRADSSGREANSISLSKYTAAAGGSLEVVAGVTGYQQQDQTTTSRYDIWAKSYYGEETYFIARNRTASTSELTVIWQIPAPMPTGLYQVCADQEHPNDNGWGGSSSIACSSLLTIDRYDLLVSFENPMPLPGEELRIHALVSSALDGSPEAPESGGYEIDYATEDADGSWNSQTKTGTFGSGSNLVFGFLLPSNIIVWNGINVQVWANGSGGDQVETTTRGVDIGTIQVNVEQPFQGTTIKPDSPFILSLNSYRSRGSSDSYPESNMELNVDIEQESVKKRIATALTTDGDGYSSSVVTLPSSSDLVDGPATIFVSWTDPADLSIRNVTSPVFISTGSGPVSGGGMGIDLTANVPNTESEPGDIVPLILETRDNLGIALPDCWIQYQIIRESSGHDDMHGVWQVAKTDSMGKLYLNITIPANLNPDSGDIEVNAIAWNKTGTTDSGIYDLQIINPDIDLDSEARYWIPGDTIMMEVTTTGMSGQITGFWSVSALDLEGMIQFDAGDMGMFEFTVPAVVDDDAYSITLIAIDGRGSIESDSSYLTRHTGISVQVQLPDVIPVGGGTLDLPYTITQLDSEQPIEFPVSWQASLVGVVDGEQTGRVNQTSGTIQLEIPATIESGHYLLQIVFENAEQWGGVQIIEVRSESDGGGVSGAFASTNDAINPVAPLISIVALLLGIIALALTLLRGGGGDDDEDSFSPSNHTSPPPAASAAEFASPPPMSHGMAQSAAVQHADPPPMAAQNARMPQSIEQMAMGGHAAPPPMQPAEKSRGPY